jgi:hypothetical protein
MHQANGDRTLAGASDQRPAMDVAWYRIAPVSCWVSRSMSRNGSKRMTMCHHFLLAEVS